MKYMVIFLISFSLVYLFYLLTVIIRKKKTSKFLQSNQVMYFVKRYNLDVNKININQFMQTISITNSFIVSVAFTFTFLTDHFLLGMLIGLVVLIPLMLICYSLIGNYYKKEGK